MHRIIDHVLTTQTSTVLVAVELKVGHMDIVNKLKSNPWYLVAGVVVVGGIVYVMHARGVF